MRPRGIATVGARSENGPGMQAERALSSLSYGEIVERCREETARFRRGEPHEDGYCFEIFHRAVVDQTEVCWEGLQAIYRDQVLAWCRRASGSTGDVDDLTAV